jgi:hypothetical protein
MFVSSQIDARDYIIRHLDDSRGSCLQELLIRNVEK